MPPTTTRWGWWNKNDSWSFTRACGILILHLSFACLAACWKGESQSSGFTRLPLLEEQGTADWKIATEEVLGLQLPTKQTICFWEILGVMKFGCFSTERRVKGVCNSRTFLSNPPADKLILTGKESAKKSCKYDGGGVQRFSSLWLNHVTVVSSL